MSHFTVLVVGPEHEKQLQPFHEFECTGINDEFVQDIDVTAECLKQADEDDPMGLGWHGLEEKTVEDESEVDREGAHKYGYAIMRDGKLIKAVNRTNPNRKWDWYSVGGRWTGFFRLKPGANGATGEPGLMTERAKEGYADMAFKRDIDFYAMRALAREEAAFKWDEVQKVIGGTPANESWEVVRGSHSSVDAAREIYHAQPRVAQFKAYADSPEGREKFGYFASVDEFNCSREEYFTRAGNAAVSTFAVLKDGRWYERGKMGWWACVSNEKDADTWHSQYANLLDELPDDTLLTVVDCHI